MRILVLVSLFALVSCNGGSKGKSASGANAIQNASIQNIWVNDNAASTLPELDLRLVEPGYIQSSLDVLGCDGTYSANGVINGVDDEEIGTDGSHHSGYIQVGNLPHVGATVSECAIVTGQLYSYLIIGNKMTFCNDATSVCEIYTKQ